MADDQRGPGHRAPQRPVDRRPDRLRPGYARAAAGPGRRRRADRGPAWAGTAGCTCSPTPARPGAGSRSPTRRAPGPRNGGTSCPPDPEAVLEGYAILDGGPRPVLLVAWTRHAISEITVHDLPTGERIGAVPLPGPGSVGGISERPEGGHEAWFAYTDNATPVTVLRYDAGSRPDLRSGPGPRRGGHPRGDRPADRLPLRRRHRGAHARRQRRRRPWRARGPGRRGSGGDRPPEPRPTILYGYGGFGHQHDPGVFLGDPRVGRKRAASTPSPSCAAAARKARTGTAAGMLDRRAVRVRRLPRRGGEAHRRRLDHARIGWASTAARTAGLLVGAAITQRPELYAAAVCSAPLLDMVRYEKFGSG